MSQAAGTFSAFLIGNESLLVQCAELLRQGGHEIRGIITAARLLREWADEQQIRVLDPAADYEAVLSAEPFDYLFSITNTTILPPTLIALPRRGAVNFHDGPLPKYGGLHATAWALLNREPTHGVTWHLMTDRADQGAILEQQLFAISDEETSLTLNTRCFEVAMESFGTLIARLAEGTCIPRSHALDSATFHTRRRRPATACTLMWDRSADELAAVGRALEFGTYANPLGVPKLYLGDTVVVARAVRVAPQPSGEPAGTLVDVTAGGLQVATASGDVLLEALSDLEGSSLTGTECAARFALRVGQQLPLPAADLAKHVTVLNEALATHEGFWATRLSTLENVELPYERRSDIADTAPKAESLSMPLPAEVSSALGRYALERDGTDGVLVALAGFLLRLSTKTRFDIEFRDSELATEVLGAEAWFAPRVPLRIDGTGVHTLGDLCARMRDELATARRRRTYARDLPLRDPVLRSAGAPSRRLSVAVEVSEEAPESSALDGCALVLTVADGGRSCRFTYNPSLFSRESVERMRHQFAVFVLSVSEDADRSLTSIPLLDEAELRTQLVEWNATETPVAGPELIHRQIELQAQRTPHAVAAVCDDESLTYHQLDALANQLAHRLRALGVGADKLVGICLPRSLGMLVSLLAVHKAGGAYLPLDPTYPRDRLAFMIEDSDVGVILTLQPLLDLLPSTGTSVICLDLAAADLATAPTEAPVLGPDECAPNHLAYVIYTSGSTGKPKGVMVEHRNVANFFTAMDQRLGTERGVWLAVTSLAFDISVLELLWTLARGYTVVVLADASHARADAHRASAASNGKHAAAPSATRARGGRTGRPLEFSLFYFSADESENSSDKYRLLMEGAKFADDRGFVAVWTPERHFHAFGGLYPNPAVTSAAVAAITKRVGIRAGSVVLPLHHPVRVAEEWSVVDNISGGRVGISFASGWQPNDFLIRPENFKDAKQALVRDLAVVKRLWRGESVTFPGPTGKDVAVRVLPRPIQAELPCWLTTAGNPESFELAGTLGVNVLTHLLGQTVEELTDKLARYRAAWRAAGHAGEGHVSLMLHTFVGDDAAEVKSLVREPLRTYLRTSISLIKQYASAFPTFKKRADGSAQPLDFESLSPEEMDALLEYSFERYYETSGLLGTPERCLEMLARIHACGVDEVACLIDFGVSSELVLEHLHHLDALKTRAQAPAPVLSEDDFSIAAQMERYGVTHLQCTPSMAGMLTAESRTREAFRDLRTLLIGGEAFPPALAAELRALTPAQILNMYGPTETTVWSATHLLGDEAGTIPIGRPIANTKLYIVDGRQEPVPVGVAGELLIGGAGVVRGYLKREALTAERFVPDPFSRPSGTERAYRTGDLARFRSDGNIEFLGRSDFQVKVRGHRIELGEIDALLGQHPDVRESVTIVREDAPGHQQLVSYTVPRSGCTVAVAALRERLRTSLPEYMIPSHILVLADLPRTPNAKIDRKALPLPEAVVSETVSASFTSPASELEATITGIWQQVLKLPRVGTRENFFEIGGHSLLAVQVHSRLRQSLGRDLSITDLFRFPTVQSLARFLATPAAPPVPSGQPTSSRAQMRQDALARRRVRPEAR